jgi:CDP-diacylglycerol--glycerol-3-phosphate 3-phosphatidyltransferase
VWVCRRDDSDPTRTWFHDVTMTVDWYASKRSIVARLDPLVRALAARGVAPDAVTLSALPIAAVGGAALALSPSAPVLLVLVPIAAGLRLVTNLLDGALARATGRSQPRGELLNEVTDRLADVLLLAPAAIVPGAQPGLVLLGVAGAILASFIGLSAKAAGGERLYGGVLSKPGRMALLSVVSIVALVAGSGAWAWFGPLLVAGTALTAAERFRVAWRRLP